MNLLSPRPIENLIVKSGDESKKYESESPLI